MAENIKFVQNYDSGKYILPPAVGTSNALYEAYPQGAGTTDFTLPQSTISSGTDHSIASSDSTIPRITVTPLTGGSSSATDTGTTSKSGVTTTDILPFPLNNIVKSITGSDKISTSGTFFGLDLSDYFTRGALILLGLVFIVGGLYLLASEKGYAPKPRTLAKLAIK